LCFNNPIEKVKEKIGHNNRKKKNDPIALKRAKDRNRYFSKENFNGQ
jgi:hypothetical protein